MVGMTARQQDIYDFIARSVLVNGYAPSTREIMAHFGMKSPNAVQGHINALQKKGYIQREKGLARTIRVIA